MVTNYKNDKTKLQMIDSCMQSHVVANWMVTYYKISSNVLTYSLNNVIFIIHKYHFCHDLKWACNWLSKMAKVFPKLKLS